MGKLSIGTARIRGWARRLNRRELVRALFFVALLGVMLARIPDAVASGRWFGHPGHHRGHWGRGHGHHFDSPAEAREHAQAMLRRALDSVDASSAQQESAAAIVERVVDDLFPLFQDHRRVHEAFVTALQNDSVDRAALQQLRESELDRWNAVSAKLVDAVADLAEVLTPEQRRDLLEHADRLKHHS